MTFIFCICFDLFKHILKLVIFSVNVEPILANDFLCYDNSECILSV